MRIEHQPNMRALQRDWLAARIVGLAGLVLIAAVAGLATFDLVSPRPLPLPRPVVASPQALAAARRQEDIALCDGALAAAQALGVVPTFAVRDGDQTRPGGAQGRYICGAKTDAAGYAITFDLACTHLGAGGNCIVPFAVTQNGTSIYRRQ
ncbi:MAG: hypothetical protein WDM86_13285 [Rhizomicrobium sp.]